jgi:formylglycine-generating enzyme required for sulfatase activity
LKANPFGLFDNQGNIWEWVLDAWEPAYYSEFQEEPAIDPTGPSSAGTHRVARGGNWRNPASYCRSSNRLALGPTFRDDGLGFRVSRVAGASRVGRQ